ncbi:triose-phosphate transporter family-domain-containing protein [Dactylonectria estremocensis]|uniref:Triose-phosphate transporter family-domain-containing protein n=1 Tax=Dactylonectria estremocensis TaxID=1079267 RepID=A0A9P9FJB1_9HYPO|nr:triose-phosphate transporter family-domain-containing protein [Dactylonectria estremocensis]
MPTSPFQTIHRPSSPSPSQSSSSDSSASSDSDAPSLLPGLPAARPHLIPPPSATTTIASTPGHPSTALRTPLAPSSASSPSTVVRPAASADIGRSSGQAAAGLSSSAARSLTDDETDDDIEMEPIAGHRRRRSSLKNMGGSQPGPSSRSRTPINEPAKISEEGSSLGGFANRSDDSGDESYTDEDLQDDEETGLTTRGKRRKQKKRQRNTQLDQRIAREKNTISAEERKEADKDVMRRLVTNGVLILLWYLFSLSISLYNKWMFDKDRLNFAFPLFTTSMHMVVQFVLSGLVLFFVPSLRPNHRHSSDLGSSRHDSETNTGMSKMFYLTRIGPCGAATGLDIGLGNTSLKFISLTFYTMCKSSSLAFVLIFAFMFRLEVPTWRLVAIIATMTLGVILMVFGEVEFKLGGFLLVISAAFFSGFRWGLTQILLLRNPSTSNPFSSIFYLTPVMFAVLISIALPVEGFGNLIEGFKVLSNEWGSVMAPLFLLFPGCLAFCMTASEFALLQRTSVVTLSIAGIFKEVVTISAASLVFHDTLTVVNFIGLLTTLAAIVAYNYIKITKMRQEAQDHVHDRHVGADDIGRSRSSTSSDINEDRDDAGLLRRNEDRRDTVVTSDGDFQPLLEPIEASDERRSRRTD